MLLPSVFCFREMRFLRSKGNYGCFVFWNLAVLCKTIPSFCPGSLAALLGETITASKNMSSLIFFFFEGYWK